MALETGDTMNKIGPITALSALLILVCLPALAQTAAAGAPPPSADVHKNGAMIFLTTLLTNPAPWVVGVISDILISKRKVALVKSIMTSIASMVLGYPSIWFAFSSFASASMLKLEEWVAWLLCSVILIVTMGLLKIVSYWLVNEKFPEKVTSLLFFASATVMVLTALGMIGLFAQGAKP